MPAGQPTKYNPDIHPVLAYNLCAKGAFRDRELAKILGVSYSTLNLWKKTHEEFSEQVLLGKQSWDEHLCNVGEKSLLKRVKGGRYTETTREPGATDLKTGKPKMVVVKTVSKVLAPDPKSILALLENRDPERWPNRRKIEMTGKDGGPMEYDAVKGRADEIQEKVAKAMEAITADAKASTKD